MCCFVDRKRRLYHRTCLSLHGSSKSVDQPLVFYNSYRNIKQRFRIDIFKKIDIKKKSQRKTLSADSSLTEKEK